MWVMVEEEYVTRHAVYAVLTKVAGMGSVMAAEDS